MELKEAFKIALQSLWANKLRSVLTLIGVVIGVSSVIAVITLTNGVNRYVATKVYGYGADVFTLSKQSPVIFSYDQWEKFQKRKNVKIDDYYAIRDSCKSCQEVGALLNTSGKVTATSHSSDNTDIRGWTWNMPGISNLNVVLGRSFVPADADDGIGHAVDADLLADGIDVGQELIDDVVSNDGDPGGILVVGGDEGAS